MAHTAFVASGSKVPSSRDGLTDIFIDDTVASLEGTFKSGELLVLIDSFRSSDEEEEVLLTEDASDISSPDPLPPNKYCPKFVPLGSTEFFLCMLLFCFLFASRSLIVNLSVGVDTLVVFSSYVET